MKDEKSNSWVTYMWIKSSENTNPLQSWIFWQKHQQKSSGRIWLNPSAKKAFRNQLQQSQPWSSWIMKHNSWSRIISIDSSTTSPRYIDQTPNWDWWQEHTLFKPPGQTFTNRLSLLSASSVNLMKKRLSTSFVRTMSFKKRAFSTSIESSPTYHTSTNIINWSLMMRSSFIQSSIPHTQTLVNGSLYNLMKSKE